LYKHDIPCYYFDDRNVKVIDDDVMGEISSRYLVESICFVPIYCFINGVLGEC